MIFCERFLCLSGVFVACILVETILLIWKGGRKERERRGEYISVILMTHRSVSNTVQFKLFKKRMSRYLYV